MFLSAPPLHILHLYLTWPNYPNRCNYYYIQYMYTTSHNMNKQQNVSISSALHLYLTQSNYSNRCKYYYIQCMYTPVYVCVYMYYPIHVYTCIHLCIYNTNLTLLTTCYTSGQLTFPNRKLQCILHTHLLQFTFVKGIVYLPVL